MAASFAWVPATSDGCTVRARSAITIEPEPLPISVEDTTIDDETEAKLPADVAEVAVPA